MKTILFTAGICLLSITGYGQQQTWTVKSGESLKTALGDSIIFRYPKFEPGIVYFKNGTASAALLNLNLTNGEMQFISPAKDTLTVDYEQTISSVVIKVDTFYFDKVFVELIQNNGVAKLAKMENFVPIDMQKMGGYDQATSTSSINSASYFFNGNQSANLTPNKLMVLRKKNNYFIGDKFNHFLPASKKNVTKLFNKQAGAINDFLKENKIVFVKEADLLKLVDLLGSFQ